VSTPDFWQRWHISLSSWIRDYLMVPLLGSGARLTVFRFIWATILTFTIIGFWHGASWNFILFGFFHGVWMTIYTLVNRNLPERVTRIPFGRPMAIAFHLVAVSLPGSLLFRETSLVRIAHDFEITFTRPFAASSDEWIAATTVVGITAICTVPLIASFFVERYAIPKLRPTVWWLPAQTTGWVAMVLVIALFFRSSAMDFVYFQF
jgi:D-alanyl-lipoteichoic acid acyltransferase DltB (MBOAT superfamily)